MTSLYSDTKACITAHYVFVVSRNKRYESYKKKEMCIRKSSHKQIPRLKFILQLLYGNDKTIIRIKL